MQITKQICFVVSIHKHSSKLLKFCENLKVVRRENSNRFSMSFLHCRPTNLNTDWEILAICVLLFSRFTNSDRARRSAKSVQIVLQSYFKSWMYECSVLLFFPVQFKSSIQVDLFPVFLILFSNPSNSLPTYVMRVSVPIIFYL